MSDILNIDQPKASELFGVQVLSTFGWRYIWSGRSREAAEAVAEEARDSKRYLKVRIN